MYNVSLQLAAVFEGTGLTAAELNGGPNDWYRNELMSELRGSSQEDSIGKNEVIFPPLLYKPGYTNDLRYVWRAPCLPRVRLSQFFVTF